MKKIFFILLFIAGVCSAQTPNSQVYRVQKFTTAFSTLGISQLPTNQLIYCIDSNKIFRLNAPAMGISSLSTISNTPLSSTVTIAIPTLAQVLAAGHLAAGLDIRNLAYVRDNSNITSVGFLTRNLFDATGSISLQFGNRVLMGTDGVTVALRWGATRTLEVGQWDYAADYSGSYTSRSLIDKGYADATYRAITSIVPLQYGGTGQNFSASKGLININAGFSAEVVSPNTSAERRYLMQIGAIGVEATPAFTRIDISTDVNGVLPIANGGTSGATALAGFNALSPLTTRGDLLTRDATNNIRLAKGATGKFLTTDANDVVWSTSTIPTSAGATANKHLISDGTNYILSTPTFPNVATGTGTILRADGTNWVASTNTFENTTASGNVLYATAANTIGSGTGLTYNGTAFAVAGATNSLIRSSATATGTTGAAQIFSINSTNGAYAEIDAFGSAYAGTLSGLNRTGMAALYLNAATGGVGLITVPSAFPLVFATTDVERARFLSGGQLLVGATTALQGFGGLEVQHNTNAYTQILSSNVSAGVNVGNGFNAANGTANFYYGVYGTGRTTSGLIVANRGYFYSDNTAGINIGCSAAGDIRLFTGALAAANERMKILSSGETLHGYSTLESAELFGFQKNQNAATYGLISNTTSGTAGRAYLGITNTSGGGTGLFMVSHSALFTTTGIQIADAASIFSNKAGGFNIGTFGAQALTFWTNNTKNATLNTTGNLKIAGTATRATTEGTNHLDIFDGTAPVGTLAAGISLYSTSGELRVMDAAGNATLLSPHDSVTNEWIYHSVHTPSGKVLKIDMERMLKALNEKFNWDFVHEDNIEPSKGGTQVISAISSPTITLAIDASAPLILAKWTASRNSIVTIAGTPQDGARMTVVITNDSSVRTTTFGSGFLSAGTAIGIVNKKCTVTFISSDGVFVEMSRTTGL